MRSNQLRILSLNQTRTLTRTLVMQMCSTIIVTLNVRKSVFVQVLIKMSCS